MHYRRNTPITKITKKIFDAGEHTPTLPKEMGKIVAIGGGKLAEWATLSIDKEIVRLTSKTHPHALFIPTASYDDEQYWKVFQMVYGEQLGCKTDVLFLLKEKPTLSVISDKINKANLIYVGGGNTLKMLRLWRKTGIDRLLVKAYRKGTVLAGLSAGAICWFRYGHSDSMSFYHPQQWNYIRVRGLDLYPFTLCPHYDGEKRQRPFCTMIEKYGGIGIALDDHCALEIVNGQYRIITSRNGVGAYRVYLKKGEVVQEEIIQDRFRPVQALLELSASPNW